MVVLADKGKGFWCRIHDGRLLTPTTYAALPSSASVAFVAIPFGALALGKVGEGDEEEILLRELWGDHVSLVAAEDERLLCFLDGQPLKSEAVQALAPSDASRVKTKTVPAACFCDGKIDPKRVAGVSEAIYEALMAVKARIADEMRAEIAADVQAMFPTYHHICSLVVTPLSPPRRTCRPSP